MRIFPIALIVIGSLGLAKHFGLIPLGMFHVIGPLLLIALGVVLLVRRSRNCDGHWRARHGASSTGAPQRPSAGRV